MKSIAFLAILIVANFCTAQSAEDIVKKADQKYRGNSSYAELTIDIVRPKWSKEMKMKFWSKGSKYSVSVVETPAKEKGIVFLMRDKEVWNYLPTIDRTVKFPPSMMLQNWMGTDLTNDDLVKQSSLITDYNKKLLGEEDKEGYTCWKIELTPKENAAVVWGKIIIWIDKAEYMQMQTDFYDEDGFLINQMIASDVKVFDNKKLPSKLKVVPIDKPGQYTMIIYDDWKFDLSIPERYFTTNYMDRLK
ncbi:MAG TPA: outer membrane lipoprotein-sorting protein [Flavobacteriaceae bacterium]|nr:outer membrane lipoprotein-sorting protein [Flavobacteriaceae bacterium]